MVVKFGSHARKKFQNKTEWYVAADGSSMAIDLYKSSKQIRQIQQIANSPLPSFHPCPQ